MSEEQSKYPKARRCGCTIDQYHDKKVPDAYRWLENPETEDVKTFVAEQNKVTEEFLSKYPFREELRKRLHEFVTYPIMTCPSKQGNKYFYYKNSGSQNQKVLYAQETLAATPVIVFDPNTLAADGTTAIVGQKVSKNGEIIGIKVTQNASDWVTVHFKNLKTMEDLQDSLENMKVFGTGMSFTHDNLGLFYARYPETAEKGVGTDTAPLQNQKLYYHRMGVINEDDILISDFPDNPKWLNDPIVSDCGKYLLNQVYQSTQHNLILYAELQEPIANAKLDFLPIINVFDAEYDYVTNDDTVFYFVTNKNAPNYRLVKIDINSPNITSWKTLIHEDKYKVLGKYARAVQKDKLLTMYTQDVRSVINLRNLSDGSIIKTFQSDTGNVTSFSAERFSSEFFYEVSSFTAPAKIFYVNLERVTASSADPKPFAEIKLHGYDPTNFTTVQVLYQSSDGTTVPMFIVKRKTTFQNGESPCLLYGYGGFNISVLPVFNPYNMFFIENFDGIVAIANIRGGGEFGSNWHDQGSNYCKQNSFNDFQAAAKFLIESYYTNKEKLAIRGVSNGGLLIGTCINQQPDLFKAAIAQKGVFDMYRFHKFTIGNNWCAEYGCSDNQEQFEYLSTYSPLHNVRMPSDCQYPSVFVTTAENDDRMPPLHSYKFIAELQSVIGHHARQKNPLLIKVYPKSGHGLGSSLVKIVQEWTDIFTFLVQELELRLK